MGDHIVLKEKEEWTLLQRQCISFLESGYLPDHVWKGVEPKVAVARAITIATKGKELGIPPLQAFSSITVIKGKPCLSAELMLALIYQRVPGAKVTFVTPPEKQATECTVVMQRPHGDPQSFSFTMADAQTAGIVRSDGPWQKFPKAMLRARAISAGARAVFPDAIMGCFTPEELGGEVIDVEESVLEQSGRIIGTHNENAPERTIENGSAEQSTSGNSNSDGKPVERGDGSDRGVSSEQHDYTAAPQYVQKTDPRGFPHGEYPRANPNWQDEPATIGQIKRLFAIGHKVFKVQGQELSDALKDFCNVDDLNELTKGRIQDVFKALENPKPGA